MPLEEVGMAKQIKIVAILMMINGGICLLTGLFYVAIGFAAPNMFDADQIKQMQAQQPGQQHLDPETLKWMMIGIYGGMGSGGIIAGLLQLPAGLRNLRYRGRTFGIVALILGMIAASTCYCAPTSIALCVYGMIVYMNNDAKAAFDARS